MRSVLGVIYVHLSALYMRLAWEKLCLRKVEADSLQTNIHLINIGSKNKETSQLRCLFSIYLTLSVCAILSNTKMRFNTVFRINTSPFYNVSLHEHYRLIKSNTLFFNINDTYFSFSSTCLKLNSPVRDTRVDNKGCIFDCLEAISHIISA